MLLYINSCVRSDSRTDRIARALLEKLGEPYEELFLPDENLQFLSEERLNKRNELIAKGDDTDLMLHYAKTFAKADKIVISAPFWDLSFPAVLKAYFENIYVAGIVSQYGADGKPHGLCKAKKLYYVTTAGGYYLPDYSYHYVRELATVHFGISETVLIKAEMLDIEGFNAEKIIQSTIENIQL